MKKSDFLILIFFILITFFLIEKIDSQESLVLKEVKSDTNEITFASKTDSILVLEFFTEKNLIKIKGIGKKLASLILLHIKKGDIKVFEDIKKVKGIGKVKFAKIKEAYDVHIKQ